jgi:hypothetical protein
MFDELYPESADAAMQAKADRPPEPKPAPRFSVWGTLTAAPKGVAAGAAEGIGSTADILGAFGQVMAATDARPGGMFSIPKRKLSDLIKGGTEQELASKRLLQSGIDYNSEAGRSFRNVSASYTPDAQTTHVSESAVFNLFRVGSKAMTAAAVGGNIPGAVIAGAEEGFTQSDQLGQQGVDLATRTKVGLVTAATNAVGFALPAAGKTWAQTGALALTGGPVSFVAQNAATREILASADYSNLADQYDPFDPVGLALSTVLPLGFGALAMRGAKTKAPTKAPAKAPQASPVRPPEDLVDAARVSLLRENMDATNPVRGDIAQADAHATAYTKAMDQQANGERVLVEVPEPVALKATQEMSARVETMRAEVAAMADEIPTQLMDQMQPPKSVDPLGTSASWVIREISTGNVIMETFDSAKVRALNSSKYEAVPILDYLVSINGKKTPNVQDQPTPARAQTQAPTDQAGAPAAGNAANPADVSGAGTAPVQANGVNKVSPLEARIAELEARMPQALDAVMPVEFDDGGKPTKSLSARDDLEQVKREAQAEEADAGLIEVAANCFLSSGS